MHPYLTRLGVKPEVQEFFSPFYRSDVKGDLLFDYGDQIEHYGFAFHRVPITNQLWIAGELNFRQVRQVFICSSAMEAVSFLNYKLPAFRDLKGLLFLATGSGIGDAQINWINSRLAEKKYTLVFGNDLLGRLLDLKTAAGIRHLPLAVHEQQGICTISFRHQDYTFKTEDFRVHSFGKLARYCFGIRTPKPKGFITYFEQLKASAF